MTSFRAFSYYTVGEIRSIVFSYKTIKRRMKRKIFHLITFTLRSFVSSPEPGPYYLSAYNADGSESSMRLLVQPE